MLDFHFDLYHVVPHVPHRALIDVKQKNSFQVFNSQSSSQFMTLWIPSMQCLSENDFNLKASDLTSVALMGCVSQKVLVYFLSLKV